MVDADEAIAPAKTHKRLKMPSADFWNAVATILLVIVGGWGIIETNHSIELSERAWIGVFSNIQLATPSLGKPLIFAVPMINTGKEPAFDMNVRVLDFQLLPVPLSGDPNEATYRPNRECIDLKPIPGGYMTSPNGQTIKGQDTAHGDHPFNVTQGFLDGKEFAVIQGCVAYRTMGKARYTYFCTTLRMLSLAATNDSAKPISADGTAAATPNAAPSANGLPTTTSSPQYQFGTCPSGNGGT